MTPLERNSGIIVIRISIIKRSGTKTNLITLSTSLFLTSGILSIFSNQRSETIQTAKPSSLAVAQLVFEINKNSSNFIAVKNNLAQWICTGFVTHFLIRLLLNPFYSPILRVVNILNQEPRNNSLQYQSYQYCYCYCYSTDLYCSH